MRPDCDVLIAGAGPTGLALACELARRSVSVRVLEQHEGRLPWSRALAVFPRTLELLEPAGVVPELLEEAVRVEGIDLHLSGSRCVQIDATRFPSRYRGVYSIHQTHTEAVLERRLAELGVQVERPTKVAGLTQDGGGVRVITESGEGSRSELTARWVVGCDGMRSLVRERAGIAFHGSAYRDCFDLADLEVNWPGESSEPRVRGFLSRRGLAFSIPLPGGRLHRIVLNRPGADPSQTPDLEELRTVWDQRVDVEGTRLDNPVWISRFALERRQAAVVRARRIFLAGDAAHVHSPVGGQGMNGGIQDAINLGWKLALVVRGQAHDALLDTYAEERVPITRAVLRYTDLATRIVSSRSRSLAALRSAIVPRLAASPRLQSRLLELIGGLATHARGSRIVMSGASPRAEAPRPGERLPSFETSRGHLYDLLSPDSHTLLVGDQGTTLTGSTLPLETRIVKLPQEELRQSLGEGAWMIRPDRLVGAWWPEVNRDRVERYFAQLARGGQERRTREQQPVANHP